MQNKEIILDTGKIARLIVDIAADKKAVDIVLLDIGKVTTLADYFVICEGNSDRQIKSIDEGIRKGLKEKDVKMLYHEGIAKSGWVLIDYGDIIVHIFSPEKREYYQLEALWRDATTLLKML